MLNDIKLGDSHPLTEELKPLKVGGKSTAIETAQHGNGARINGGLEITGTIPKVTTPRITADSELVIKSGRSLTLHSATGNFIAMTADEKEFSVANSAYAGMILGYRLIGEDVVHSSYTLTTGFAVPHADMTVRFIAPPSGNVEVMVQIFRNSSTSNRIYYYGLSDNATYNTIGVQYEQMNSLADETDDFLTTHRWGITGLTPGDTYNYWFGAKISFATGYFSWGGDSSGRNTDFIMKVTALPSATADFAVYG